MKFVLVENRSKYKMSSLLRATLRSLMHDTTPEYCGQTALKKYLCTNRGVSFSKNIDVHHIDGNHDNYKDVNLALLTHEDHKKLHESCKNDVLAELRDEVYQGGPDNITLHDLNNNVDQVIIYRYKKLLIDRVDEYRQDLVRSK